MLRMTIWTSVGFGWAVVTALGVTVQAYAVPRNIATGPNPNVDGYLRIGADEYGSCTSVTFGGGLGDIYNPAGSDAGGLGPLEATFSNGFMIFVDTFPPDGIFDARELLSDNAMWQSTNCAGANIQSDDTLLREVIFFNNANDTNADGVDDLMTSRFQVLDINFSVDLLVDVLQAVFSGEGNSIALLIQRYTITNLHDDPVTFNLVRIGDFDLVYNGTAVDDDSVGTDRAVAGNAVFQREDSTPATRITMISADATDYAGGINGVMPTDGPPAFSFGTSCEQWDAFGLPATWADEIARVGNQVNGESGAQPFGCTDPCDGHIELNIPVVDLGVGQSVQIFIRYVYGATCGSDCGPLPDGMVGITDFLHLLSQWGGASRCDSDGGGVGVTDFLTLLADWGPCR